MTHQKLRKYEDGINPLTWTTKGCTVRWIVRTYEDSSPTISNDDQFVRDISFKPASNRCSNPETKTRMDLAVTSWKAPCSSLYIRIWYRRHGWYKEVREKHSNSIYPHHWINDVKYGTYHVNLLLILVPNFVTYEIFECLDGVTCGLLIR